MNLERAKQLFSSYVASYNANDGQIKLKIIHTYNVVAIAKQIAVDLDVSKEDIELAQIIALLHDIGRFEQIKRYHTFLDANSVNHALLGVSILQQQDFIRSFIEDACHDDIIYTAIRNHNRYALEDGLSQRQMLHAKIIRDADKTDIFRLNVIEPVELLYLCNQEQLNSSTISDAVYEDFQQHICVLTSKRKTNLDFMIAQLAFIFDFNFRYGLQCIQQQGYIPAILNRCESKDEETRIKLHFVLQTVEEYIAKRIV